MLIKNIIQVLKFSLAEPDYAIKSIKFRALNLFNYKKPQLKKLILLLTYKCNLSCKMCALGENRNKNIQLPRLQQELYLEDIRDVIDFAQKTNSSVWLTGGEPLLHSRWTEIAKYVKEKKMRCNLQTNGALLKKYKKEIVDYIDFLNVSLDGISDIHDYIRGEKDIFNKVMEGIISIDEQKKMMNTKKPYLNICYTVTEESFPTLNIMIDVLQKSDININNFNFQHLEFVNSDILEIYKKRFKKEGIDKNLINFLNITNLEIDAENLAETIKRVKKYKSKFDILFFPDFSEAEIKKYYNSPQDISKRIFRNCQRPYEEIFIHPSGEIWTCPTLLLGNIKNEKIETLWKRIPENIKYNDYSICQNCLGELFMYYMAVLYITERRE